MIRRETIRKQGITAEESEASDPAIDPPPLPSASRLLQSSPAACETRRACEDRHDERA